MNSLRRGGPPGAGEADFSTPALRALFPGLGNRIRRHLDAGRDALAAGRVEDARSAFRRAADVDPSDPDTLSYLAEIESTLAIAGELTPRKGERPGSLDLDPRRSEAEKRALEARIAEEESRRLDLLAALAVLDEEAELPPLDVLHALRPTPVQARGEPPGFGLRVARDRSGGDVQARAAFAPDGQLIARYYFASGEELPTLREEATRGDAAADRWTGYRGTARHELWEDRSGSGHPDVHVVFDEDGRQPTRIEMDTTGSEEPDRIFEYERGALRRELRDSTGDGRFDRVDHFDAQGRLELRERDLNGDGRTDERSEFDAGRLVRRTLDATRLEPGEPAQPVDFGR